MAKAMTLFEQKNNMLAAAMNIVKDGGKDIGTCKTNGLIIVDKISDVMIAGGLSFKDINTDKLITDVAYLSVINVNCHKQGSCYFIPRKDKSGKVNINVMLGPSGVLAKIIQFNTEGITKLVHEFINEGESKTLVIDKTNRKDIRINYKEDYFKTAESYVGIIIYGLNNEGKIITIKAFNYKEMLELGKKGSKMPNSAAYKIAPDQMALRTALKRFDKWVVENLNNEFDIKASSYLDAEEASLYDNQHQNIQDADISFKTEVKPQSKPVSFEDAITVEPTIVEQVVVKEKVVKKVKKIKEEPPVVEPEPIQAEPEIVEQVESTNEDDDFFR